MGGYVFDENAVEPHSADAEFAAFLAMPATPFTVLLTDRTAAPGSPQDTSELAKASTVIHLTRRFMAARVICLSA